MYKKIDLKSINELVIYITTPCLIVSSLSKFPIDLNIAGKIFLVSTVIILTAMLIGLIVIRLLKLEYEIFLPPVIFANTGKNILRLAITSIKFLYPKVHNNQELHCTENCTLRTSSKYSNT